MNGYVWVAYSKTPPFLPIAVADTAAELGEMVGVSKNCINATLSHFKRGDTRTSRFYRVEIGKGDVE